MSTTKHTAGPWRYIDRSEHSGIPSSESTIPFGIEKVVNGGVIPIADICSFPYTLHGDKNEVSPEMINEMRANAELIAKAPELAALVTELTEALEEEIVYQSGKIAYEVLGSGLTEQHALTRIANDPRINRMKDILSKANPH